MSKHTEHDVEVGEKIDMSGNGSFFKYPDGHTCIITMPNGGYVKISSDSRLKVVCAPE